ncbi:Uncharacterised protein [Mycobacterium tuberculosis]|nr:Uncharacterised protein [Mycobacterium tuberculosis]
MAFDRQDGIIRPVFTSADVRESHRLPIIAGRTFATSTGGAPISPA